MGLAARDFVESRAGAAHAGFERVVLTVAGLCTGLLFGLSYEVGNQTTYLLAPLRHLDPAFLRRDWLAAHTYAYHPSFTWVIAALAQVGPLAWTTAILNLLLVPVALLLIHELARQVSPDDALGATLLVVLAMIVDRTESVGQSYIFGGYLQPSVLASVAFIGAMAYFVRARWVVSGLWLGAAALLHANYLIVGILAFGIAQLLLGGEQLPRRLLSQLFASAAVFIADLPVFLRLSGSGGDGRQAMYLFEVIRSPHHYLPAHFIGETIPFAGWMLLFAAALAYVAPPPLVRKRLVALGVSLAVPVVIATVVGLVVPVSRLAQLYLWRLAPFAVVLAQVVVGLAVTRFLGARTPAPADAHATRWRAVALTGAVLVCGYYLRRAILYGEPLVPAVCLAAFACVIGVVHVVRTRHPASSRVGPPVPIRLALPLFVVGTIGLSAREFPRHSNLFRSDLPLPERGLHAWAAATPRDAIFIVPPNLDRFRLRTGRAIVVDWKSTPILPAELLEWYRRISLESGGPPASIGDAERGYEAMSASRLQLLRTTFGADFAIMPRSPKDSVTLPLPVAYRNARFIVYALADTGAIAASRAARGESGAASRADTAAATAH